MIENDQTPEHKINRVANYLFRKYIRNKNRSAAPEHKSFFIEDIQNELLVSYAVASLLCTRPSFNYYYFEKVILKNL